MERVFGGELMIVKCSNCIFARGSELPHGSRDARLLPQQLSLMPVRLCSYGMWVLVISTSNNQIMAWIGHMCI